ncbi:MAG: ABC transporter permease [Bacteroidales bacterium]|nr:ABC transporter permease [Bacteroidales bacterium]
MSNLPLRFALRYLFARKSHNVINIISGISVAGMAIGTAALVIILSVFNGFNKLVSDSLGDAQPDLVVKPAAGKAFVPDSTAFAWLYDQEMVYNMSSVIEEQAFISFDGKQSLARVKGVDSVFEEESPIRNHITDGIFSLHRGTLPRAVIGSALAWSMDINPRFIAPLEIYYPDREGSISLSNPAASLRSTKVTVAGLFALNAELDAELVLVPIETMRELLDYDDEVSGVEIRVTEGTTEKALKGLVSQLQDRLGPDFEVQDRYRQNEALYKMMRYEKLAIYMILIFIVVIIAFNIYSSLTMLIIEKKDDIGTLRSLGAPEQMTRRIFLLEGWLISLLGLVVGLALGIACVLLQQKFGLIRMPGSYIISAYPVILKASDIIWTAVGVAIVGYLIALLPSLTKTTDNQ